MKPQTWRLTEGSMLERSSVGTLWVSKKDYEILEDQLKAAIPEQEDTKIEWPEAGVSDHDLRWYEKRGGLAESRMARELQAYRFISATLRKEGK